MKVGDLVRCPAVEWGFETLEPAYTGVITEVCGYKVGVFGGRDGHKTWDMADLKLINTNVAPSAPGGGNDESR
jgi:hypothetical protein